MMALDSIASALNLTWSQNRTWKSDITETTIRVESKQQDIKEYQVTLLKPRKLMNISGSCVAQAGKLIYNFLIKRVETNFLFTLVKDLSIPLKNLYVFHDDMQRDLGKVNLKGNGSANGHNGIKSVIDNLKTQEFKRVRIGIGRPPPEIDDRSYDVVANFVLGKFSQPEINRLEEIVYPMWTKNQGLELLCDKGELFKALKIRNKNASPNKWEKKQQKRKAMDWGEEEDEDTAIEPAINKAA
jgi:PTH1 family peptidyl-tRNA hydrolase